MLLALDAWGQKHLPNAEWDLPPHHGRPLAPRVTAECETCGETVWPPPRRGGGGGSKA
ncbi:MAG TPA: hypothetical protein VN238_11815 [Solirubrobacteraceae bacterium]|nr:hypothetical protein [Solirubrobacteraceae bacterium]